MDIFIRRKKHLLYKPFPVVDNTFDPNISLKRINPLYLIFHLVIIVLLFFLLLIVRLVFCPR